MLLACGGMLVSVSYTHLDVYKRQVYYEGGGLEHQFQYLPEEVTDVLLHVVHPTVYRCV